MEPNWLADMWTAAKQAGPFGTLLMLIIWWKTDAERLRLQRDRDALLERVVKALEAAADAMENVVQWSTRRRS